MTTDNPYRPPSAPITAAASATAAGDCWRDDKALVAYDQSTLPARCIKCGAPAQMPLLARNYYWHHPALYLLLLVNLLIYAIVAAIVRKRVRLNIGLCAEHARRRATAILGGTLGVVLGIGLLIAGFAAERGDALLVLGAVLCLASTFALLIFARTLTVRSVRDGEARLHGCNPAFLALLPRSRPRR